MKYTKGEILLNDEIQTGIYKMVVKDKNKAKAGQFYIHLLVLEEGLFHYA